VLFLAGAVIMAYNLWRTARGEIRETEPLASEGGAMASISAQPAAV